MAPQVTPAAPSRLWSIMAAAAFTTALLLAWWAVVHQVQATRPVGEGELFSQEARMAAELLIPDLQGGEDPDQAVRRLRNALQIEVVALVDDRGRIGAATSPTLSGTSLDPFLRESLAEGRLAAVATPLHQDVLLDGVREWTAGEVLYQVVHPLEEGPGGLLLMYDLSELLARRAQVSGIRPFTLQLAGGAVTALVAGTLLLAGRVGARRRIREAELERRFLEERSRELERHNRELEEARREAERALSLAEETNRIRSEFVLMINHELRTPLTSLVTGAELLLDDDLPEEETRSVLADMVRDGRRLKDLISQMLLVARIENQGLSYALQEVGVEDVRRRLEATSGRVDLRGFLPDLGIRTDPEALTHLLLSLADNAFTHGASTVRLEVADSLPFESMVSVGEVPDRAIWFLVQDDGPGIDPEFLPRIFEKFEKWGSESGTGLGLYLARMMAEGIEACIGVSTGPEGTIMAVGIPSAVSPARAEVTS